MKWISPNCLAAISQKPKTTEGNRDIKEKHIFSKAKENLFTICLIKGHGQSQSCTSNICALSLFQHRQTNISALKVFLSGIPVQQLAAERLTLTGSGGADTVFQVSSSLLRVPRMFLCLQKQK